MAVTRFVWPGSVQADADLEMEIQHEDRCISVYRFDSIFLFGETNIATPRTTGLVCIEPYRNQKVSRTKTKRQSSAARQ
jgi:hypothetical protein